MLTKTTAAALATIASASIAALPGAEAHVRSDDFKVAFTFSADAPAEDIYRSFRQTAREACADGIDRRDRLYSFEVRRVCAEELVNKAVHQSGLSALIAVHISQTGTTPSTPERVTN